MNKQRENTDGFVPLHTVTLTLCELCINGVGGECHSPGCDLWIHRAPDIPILAAQGPSLYSQAHAEVMRSHGYTPTADGECMCALRSKDST